MAIVALSVSPRRRSLQFQERFWLSWSSTNQIKIGKQFSRNLQGRGLQILAEMLAGRCPRNQQDAGRAMEEPGKRKLHGRYFARCCGCVECRRLQWSEPSQRKKRNISDPLRGEDLDEGVILPLCHVVEVLHADDLGDRLCLSYLLRCYVAQTDMPDQPLPLELCEHG